LSCLSQQRNCLFLPRVRRAALVRAGGAAAAARAAAPRRPGAPARGSARTGDPSTDPGICRTPLLPLSSAVSRVDLLRILCVFT
ncbi:hypothetical protein EK904_004791, partial [Melospiza melodia maxima]